MATKHRFLPVLSILVFCLLIRCACTIEETTCIAGEEGVLGGGNTAECAIPALNPDVRTRSRSVVSSNDPTCVDEDDFDCQDRALLGYCTKRPSDMLTKCPYSCAFCNNHMKEKLVVRTCYGEDQSAGEPETLEVIRKMQQYMINTVLAEDTYESVRAECKNRHKDCSYWASIGECEANIRYMQTSCAPACRSCDQLDYRHRCPFDATTAKGHTVWTEPGELDAFFWSLIRSDSMRERYNLTVLSGPIDALSVSEQKPDVAKEELEDDAWVVQLEDFLSPDECNRLIEIGQELGYERSKDVGKQKFDGSYDSVTTSDRTSSTAWCHRDTICGKDPVTKAVTARIEELVGIHSNHSESLQLLRYEVGQHYGIHHDYTSHLVDRPPGVRILTVFLYLNHEGLQGGGTNFPNLGDNLTVQPKQGRAVVWPSVLNDKPGKKNRRTKHQALPVEAGVKYGANAWIHERDFQTPQARGCAR